MELFPSIEELQMLNYEEVVTFSRAIRCPKKRHVVLLVSIVGQKMENLSGTSSSMRFVVECFLIGSTYQPSTIFFRELFGARADVFSY